MLKQHEGLQDEETLRSWRIEGLHAPQCEATGPDGQRVTVTDTVVAVERLR